MNFSKDFANFSKSKDLYNKNEQEATDDVIEFNGKKIRVFSKIELNNKAYIVTIEKAKNGRYGHRVLVKNGDIYEELEQNQDEVYDFIKKAVRTKVKSDVIFTEKSKHSAKMKKDTKDERSER